MFASLPPLEYQANGDVESCVVCNYCLAKNLLGVCQLQGCMGKLYIQKGVALIMPQEKGYLIITSICNAFVFFLSPLNDMSSDSI